mmetsp:Transcript_1228/g.4131  ORF Transcript_1228/g.4131 Transcript_1228/m.4131 type:complete len:769 (+) Transcript_1228:313-2619(+)
METFFGLTPTTKGGSPDDEGGSSSWSYVMRPSMGSSEADSSEQATPPNKNKNKASSPPEEQVTRGMTSRHRAAPLSDETSMFDDEQESTIERLRQVEAENERLRSENERLRASPQLGGRSLSLSGNARLRRRQSVASRKRHNLRDTMLHTVDPSTGEVRRDHMARAGSIHTASILRNLPRRASSLLPDGRPGQTRKHAAQDIARHICGVFAEVHLEKNVQYLTSPDFAAHVVELSDFAARRFEREPRVLKLESPAYVFGDLHGNLEDLHFFADHVWKLGVELVAGNLVFLGDYVDRGMSSLEVVAYLFALKVLEPTKVWLLRGNHETRDVNGWKDHYEERSFLWQCEYRFGGPKGRRVWDAVNMAFDRLPLAAVIDDDIFCVHGGIPRRPPDAALERLARAVANKKRGSATSPPGSGGGDQQQPYHTYVGAADSKQLYPPGGAGGSPAGGSSPAGAAGPGGAAPPGAPSSSSPSHEAARSERMLLRASSILRQRRDSLSGLHRLDLLDMVPPCVTINPPDPECDPALHQMASECVWSDPSAEEQERSLDPDGFGESLRGGGTVCFGQVAIENFLRETGCSFVMRAHEAHAHGVSLSKMATVFTIFSTSKDHRQGQMAQCGCVLVDLHKLQVINRSPHYKDRYVHRRNSSALLGLRQDQLDKRTAIGLIIPNDDEPHDAYDEDFDDIDQDLLPDLDEEYADDAYMSDEDDERQDDDGAVDDLARQVPNVAFRDGDDARFVPDRPDADEDSQPTSAAARLIGAAHRAGYF